MGKVPGLNITSSGAIGSASRITIRGNNSIGGNTQALIVVDGIPINADGIKKSISSPGIGNYITMASAVNETKQFSDDLNKSFVIAHGTGTFQNRSTESHVLSSVANGMNLKDWKITGLKGLLGHTMGPAAGDELTPVMVTVGFDAYPIPLPAPVTMDILPWNSSSLFCFFNFDFLEDGLTPLGWIVPP